MAGDNFETFTTCLRHENEFPLCSKTFVSTACYGSWMMSKEFYASSVIQDWRVAMVGALWKPLEHRMMLSTPSGTPCYRLIPCCRNPLYLDPCCCCCCCCICCCCCCLLLHWFCLNCGLCCCCIGCCCWGCPHFWPYLRCCCGCGWGSGSGSGLPPNFADRQPSLFSFCCFLAPFFSGSGGGGDGSLIKFGFAPPHSANVAILNFLGSRGRSCSSGWGSGSGSGSTCFFCCCAPLPLRARGGQR